LIPFTEFVPILWEFSMDFVVQGKVYQNDTCALVKNLLDLDFCDRVIISCWETCDIDFPISGKVEVVHSKPPEHAGDANRNLQIVSSRSGIKASSSEICAKLRSDQIISVESLKMMNDFYAENRQACAEGQSGAVCVAGIWKPYPFHPSDFIFWGPREELVRIFDIPLNDEPHTVRGYGEYSSTSRTESYIGVHYAAKFDKSALFFSQNISEFLPDSSPRRAEAMKVSDELTPKIFKPFPRIEFSWHKQRLSSYHYHITEPLGEYWNEEAKWKNRR